MDARLLGSWHLEGVVTLLDQPDPEAVEGPWKPNRTAPQKRIALRGVGSVFRADGTGETKSLRDPPVGPPVPFRWSVEAADGRLYLVWSHGRQRLWVRDGGQALLAEMHGISPWVAFLLHREDPPATFEKA